MFYRAKQLSLEWSFLFQDLGFLWDVHRLCLRQMHFFLVSIRQMVCLTYLNIKFVNKIEKICKLNYEELAPFKES